MRQSIALLADTHTGHKLGLLNPKSKLKDEAPNGDIVEQDVNLSEIQKWIWNIFIGGKEKLAGMEGRKGIIHAGDATQGNKYMNELLTTRMADQVMLAVDVLSELADTPGVDFARIAKGTGSHEFADGSSAILIAESLSRSFPSVDVSCVYHGLLDIDGVGIDYSHHGPPPGSREWLRGNEARYYLRSFMLHELLRGRTPARLVLRAHYHEPVIEELTVNGYKSTLIVLPSLCMIDGYSRQAAKSPYDVTKGMMIVEIENGNILNITQHLESIDIRTKETL